MPRRPRLELPGVSMHVRQRGVNRGAVFVDDEDRTHSMSLLAETAATGALVIDAYVLVSNPVHLLVSSGELGSIS